jgi:hypothetical protein
MPSFGVLFVSSTETRLQLCGIAFVLAGGFHDLQMYTRGFTTPGNITLGSLLVAIGMFMAVSGLILPLVASRVE